MGVWSSALGVIPSVIGVLPVCIGLGPAGVGVGPSGFLLSVIVRIRYKSRISSNIAGTFMCGFDFRLRSRASKAWIVSMLAFCSGLSVRMILSATSNFLYLLNLIILNGKLFSLSMCLVLTRKAKISGVNLDDKIGRFFRPSFKGDWLRSPVETFPDFPGPLWWNRRYWGRKFPRRLVFPL